MTFFNKAMEKSSINILLEYAIEVVVALPRSLYLGIRGQFQPNTQHGMQWSVVLYAKTKK